jgi:hypothetical protein
MDNYEEMSYFFNTKWQKLIGRKTRNKSATKSKFIKQGLNNKTYQIKKNNLAIKLNYKKRRLLFLNNLRNKYKFFPKYKNTNINNKFYNYKLKKGFGFNHTKLKKNVTNRQTKFKFNKTEGTSNYMAQAKVKNYKKWNVNYRNILNSHQKVNYELPHNNIQVKSDLYIDRLNFKFDENRNISQFKYKKKY